MLPAVPLDRGADSLLAGRGSANGGAGGVMAAGPDCTTVVAGAGLPVDTLAAAGTGEAGSNSGAEAVVSDSSGATAAWNPAVLGTIAPYWPLGSKRPPSADGASAPLGTPDACLQRAQPISSRWLDICLQFAWVSVTGNTLANSGTLHEKVLNEGFTTLWYLLYF